MLGKHCSDARVHACLNSNKEQWTEAGFLHQWHGIKPDEMIDAIFNGGLFHSVPEKRSRMREIQELMHEVLAHHCLMYSLYTRMLAIRNINWQISTLTKERQYIRIPEESSQQN